jgi:hypothetical protein
MIKIGNTYIASVEQIRVISVYHAQCPPEEPQHHAQVVVGLFPHGGACQTFENMQSAQAFADDLAAKVDAFRAEIAKIK